MSDWLLLDGPSKEIEGKLKELTRTVQGKQMVVC